MLRRLFPMPRILLRQSSSGLSSPTMSHLLAAPLHLSAPIVCPLPSSAVIIKHFSPAKDNNLTPKQIYLKGIGAFQKGNYEDGYAAWMAAFPEKDLQKNNQDYIDRIFQFCEKLKLKISHDDFEIFLRYHGKAKMLWEVIFNACCDTNDLEHNQASFSAILKNMDQLSHLEKLYRWLNDPYTGGTALAIQKSRNKLVEHIAHAENLEKILMHVNKHDIRIFDLLMENASYIPYVADNVKGVLVFDQLKKMLGLGDRTAEDLHREASFALR